MRLLPSDKQSAILTAACDFFRFHSHFKLDTPSSRGLCGSSVRVITGEDEGLFGWIAVNYLMDGFTHAKDSVDSRATYGFLDMGGASTQIAFEPGIVERERHANSLIEVKLRLLGGDEIHHQVFVTTWLGYGTNQARERYVGQAVATFESHRISHSEDDKELVPDPCLPVGLTLTETPVHTGPSTAHARKPHTLLGTGSFEQCLKQTASLLNKAAPCAEPPCLFNGVHVPPIDFSVSHFIGVSEYWYSSEHVFGLGGAYDVVQYERAASEFCSRSWKELVHAHDMARTAAGHIGGDGEVEHDGRVVGKWSKDVELSRLEMQCFKAAWIVNVLHEGIGLPRIVDPGGNRTTNGADEADEKAEQKGLGGPAFQSLDTVGDTAISWTLGKMVLEASKEVPPALAGTPPLRDPINLSSSKDDVFYTSEPIRPPFIDFDKFEDHISHRLPSSLTRHSLGVSPFAILFYFTIGTIVLSLIYRLRHRVRTTIRRMSRRSFKREKPELIFDAYGVEESKIGTGSSRPSTPFSSSPPSPTGSSPSTQGVLSNASVSLRRVLSSFRSQIRPGGLSAPKSSSIRHAHSSPGRCSPRATTASAFPAFPPAGNVSFHSTSSRSGSSTPPGIFDDPHLLNTNGLFSGLGTGIGVNAGHPLYAFAQQSRSRNSSQMNLTTLVPRGATSSRSTNTQQMPPFASH